MDWKKNLNLYGLPDKVIIILVALVFLSSVAEMIGIGMFLPIFEFINSQAEPGGNVDPDGVLHYINAFLIQFGVDPSFVILLLITFTMFLVSKIIMYVVSYTKAYYLGKITRDMRNKLLKKYLSASSKYYDRVDMGHFVNSNISELGPAVTGVMTPINLIVTSFSAIGSIALLFILSYQLTIASVIIIVLSMVYPYRWVKATTGAGKKNSRFNSKTTSFLLGRLRSPRLVRLSGTADSEMHEYSYLTEKQRQLMLIVHVLKARVNLVLEPVVIGISLVMLYFSMMVLKLELSVVILFMAVTVRIVPIINSLVGQVQGYNKSKGPILFINNLLADLDSDRDFSMDINQSSKYVDKFRDIESIDLNKIFYKYSEDESFALNNVSFSIKKSSITAIIGPSGSGKSTLVDIISGYRHPTSGKLLINKIVSDNFGSSLLSSLISYVPQEPQIFDGTIYSHISYGLSNTTIEKVKNAAILSGAYEFIKNLPDEFNTLMIDNGSNFSGGQKRKIDIARSLMKDTPILILDEPTSGLDLFSEKDFIKIMNNIRQNTNKIIIIISHQPRVVINADQIIILENGSVIGCGTHTSLLSTNNWYRKMTSDSYL
jgi:ABC-type multidrug transport system fused ATPase/permease subunit